MAGYSCHGSRSVAVEGIVVMGAVVWQLRV